MCVIILCRCLEFVICCNWLANYCELVMADRTNYEDRTTGRQTQEVGPDEEGMVTLVWSVIGYSHKGY